MVLRNGIPPFNPPSYTDNAGDLVHTVSKPLSSSSPSPVVLLQELFLDCIPSCKAQTLADLDLTGFVEATGGYVTVDTYPKNLASLQAQKHQFWT